MAIRIPSQNQVIITGRLTRDPEFRATQKGTTVCFFDIASNRRIKDPISQEWKDDPTYVPMIAWGPIADKCRDKIKKGTPVYIEGRLSNSEYTSKDGTKVKRLRVVVNKIQILEAIKSDSQEPTNSSISHDSIINEEDEDIPF
ncbi:MAG: single-stranded DNA-binding protein [Elusimicrobiales bacterium]|nr:single-stranded DNA-binding protein [Elusimicrobiales bacterium]